MNVVDRFDMAKEKPVALYIGSSAAVPPKAYIIDLDSKKFSLFQDPSKADFAHVQLGRVERWTFKNKNGTEIEGRIYYPPDFNPQRKYPLIVNYYGGTSPVTRSFGGRYPLNVYAAQGYVVYVLQPSGATGFGQAFSSLHGSVDTNVPPGESTQLFTALKLLGREVEYIQIMDQDHHIMTYNKRILWTKTILAWFDRWLKRQPEWWESLYPNR